MAGKRQLKQIKMTRWSEGQYKQFESDRLDKKPKPLKETANQITRNVIRAINMQPGCVAYRINNVGVWDAEKQVYRKGNTQPGLFDVSGIVKGRALWVEIKAGRDKPSREQLIFRQEVERAGGLAWIVYSTDEFLKMFTELLKA